MVKREFHRAAFNQPSWTHCIQNRGEFLSKNIWFCSTKKESNMHHWNAPMDTFQRRKKDWIVQKYKDKCKNPKSNVPLSKFIPRVTFFLSFLIGQFVNHTCHLLLIVFLLLFYMVFHFWWSLCDDHTYLLSLIAHCFQASWILYFDGSNFYSSAPKNHQICLIWILARQNGWKNVQKKWLVTITLSGRW